jgi:hypothetical protein
MYRGAGFSEIREEGGFVLVRKHSPDPRRSGETPSQSEPLPPQHRGVVSCLGSCQLGR